MSDPARLADLLEEVPATRLEQVARELFTTRAIPAGFSWQNRAGVVALIDSFDSPGADVPALLGYAARLTLEAANFIEVSEWVDTAGRARGLDDGALRQLFAEAGGLREPSAAPREKPSADRVWGGVPRRSPGSIGRETLLLAVQGALQARSRTSLLPAVDRALGGVGKTQLAVEFAYRFADRYDLVWWIPSEQQSLTLGALAGLAPSLGISSGREVSRVASSVVDALGSTARRWLLIFDNATEPEDLLHLIPPVGGHVIVTSRNQAWAEVWKTVEVGAFERTESLELLRRRSPELPDGEADRLAETLGDLPLALDQAAAWQSATRTSGPDYLEVVERYRRALAGGDARSEVPGPVAILIRLVLDRLRRDRPEVAQLFGMFAVLGAEPVAIDLFRRGRHADIAVPLGPALNDFFGIEGIVRHLVRCGLAKTDAGGGIQVHRLFRRALRDELDGTGLERIRTDVHRLLGAANPGSSYDAGTLALHGKIAPHVLPADLIAADEKDSRRVVLDQVGYLLVIGDHDGAYRLGEAAVQSWEKRVDQPDLGPEGALTLLATRALVTASLRVGVNDRARVLAESAFERLRTSAAFGPDHPLTLFFADVVPLVQRVAGDFRQALATDRENVERHRRAYGEDDPETLRNIGNLAVNLRMLSDFAGAYEVDSEVVRILQRSFTAQDRPLLFVRTNLARDLVGLGRYAEAFALQERVLSSYRKIFADPRQPEILLADRTQAIVLRKLGRLTEAVATSRTNLADCTAHYGDSHEHTLAAAMTYANALRASGSTDQAEAVMGDTLTRYRRIFGTTHPLTLAASVNSAIIARRAGHTDAARRTDEQVLRSLTDELGEEHGFTLCAASGLANDLSLAGDKEGARRLAVETLAVSQRVRGELHPYTLLCAANAGLFRAAGGEPEGGRRQLADATGALSQLLGRLHPEALDARRAVTLECDIEPPPT